MKPKKIKVGDVFQLNGGGSCTVIEYLSWDKIRIKHNDEFGHIAIVESGNLRKGNIRNPYARNAFKTGMFGVGPHSARCGRGKTAAYALWSGIIQRGYCPNFKRDNPSYIDVSVCAEWHNFQVFAEWFYSQPNAGRKGFQLDKDLLIIGSREYSPSACSFLPSQINSILNDCASRRGDLKQGVSLYRGSYLSRISIEGKPFEIGVFKTEKEAYLAYKKEKVKYVRLMAEKYRRDLHPQVYENLKNWTL